MIYDFTDDEVNAFGVLIDEALKATGIKYAIAAGNLAAKLRAPYQAAPSPVGETLPDKTAAAPAANDAADAPIADAA